MKQSIGNFLLRRLKEAGVEHIFGVPGDYNLELMQQLEERGDPAWIGNCNELNGSYATDAYARINGLGAMVVTHGVGALSAINGIAGAYAEHVPVILISGSLPLRAVQQGALMHHTLCDREKGNFCRMFAEVTAAQAQLTPENAAAEIDRLILTAWRRKLPVFLELPSDISYLEIEAPERPLETRNDPERPGKLKSLRRDDPGEIEGRPVAGVSVGFGCDPFRRLRADHGTCPTLSDAGRDAELCQRGSSRVFPPFRGHLRGYRKRAGHARGNRRK